MLEHTLLCELPNIKNPFIQDGVSFVTQGMKLDDMREILEQREAFRYKRELHESELMKTMGTYAPAFGMVGTLIGLVFTITPSLIFMSDMNQRPIWLNWAYLLILVTFLEC